MKQRIVIAAALLAVAAAWPAQAAPLAEAILVDDTLDNPVYVTGAPGASSSTLLFVVEQPGTIRVLDNEALETTPFLNIMSLVSFGGERGLLSVAFPSDYESSSLFYVAYTNMDGDVEVDEFKRMVANPKRADATSRRRVLVVPHRAAGNHNGGQLQFGPDGLLYISIGDGGADHSTARDLKVLLGKILRIDPKKRGPNPYAIPSGNPFVGTANRGEIYSYGFRNPWRFSFDGTRIAVADVGETRQEEINFLSVGSAKGTNFGWPQYEGKQRFDNSQAGPGPAKFPMYTYNHNSGGCAIIGGYIARDPGIPAIRGKYLFGDLCTGRISVLTPNVPAQTATDVRFTSIVATGLTSFGVGPANRIYITQTSGQLSRIAEPL